jgi:hypothetical protein
MANSAVGTAIRWYVEIQVPMTADGIDWPAISNQFLFFFEVHKTLSSTPSTPPFGWPRALDSITEAGWMTTHANPVWWGKIDMTSSAACNGLSLPGYSSIGAQDPLNPTGALTSSIRYKLTGTNDITNVIVARVKNDTYKQEIDGGTIKTKMLPVDNVRVRFKIANWGIPPASASYWSEIPATTPPPNPTTPTMVPINPSILDPNGYVTTVTPNEVEFTINWLLSASEIAQYTTDITDLDGVNEAHQCILAEIEAPDANIVTRSVHRNMNFNGVNADGEPFSHKADISAEGYGNPFGGSPGHKFLLRIFTRTWNVNLDDKDVRQAGFPKRRKE